MMESNRIAVIGVGRLGLCLALNLEASRFEVIGVDVDPTYLRALQDRTFHSNEPGVDELLRQARNLRFTHSLDSAIEAADTVFVLVPTPSREDGGYDHSAIDLIVDALVARGSLAGFKHLVISSTVMPGYCDQVAARLTPLGWAVSYNPEFIAQGTILRDQRSPDLILIGGDSKSAGDEIAAIHERICDRTVPVRFMTRLEAEITKIALNSFLTTKISFANMVGDLAVRAGAKPETILSAVGTDSRVGTRFLAYGFGYGGPCLPRDNRALGAFAARLGVNTDLAAAVDRSNRAHLAFLVDQFCAEHERGSAVTVGPVAYKQGSASIEESQQLAYAAELARRGYSVTLRDSPNVLEAVQTRYGDLFTGYQPGP